MKRIAWYTAIILATLTVLILLWQFRHATVMFLLSLATAAAFRPLIDFFIQRHLPKGVALILAYLLVIVIVGALLASISNPLLKDIEDASNQLAVNYERIKTQWPQSSMLYQRTIADQLPPSSELYAGLSSAQGSVFLQALMGATANLLSFFGDLATILILSLYWSADYVHFERLWLSLIQVEKRTRAREVWRAIEQGVGAYIRSETIQSLLAGVLLGLGYRIIGLSYPTLLAVVGALAWLIPWFGGLIALIFPILVGLGVSIQMGLIAGMYTAVILILMEMVIEPRFFRREHFSSVLLVLVLVALAKQFGMIGLILAPLLAAAIQITGRYLLQPPAAASAPSVAATAKSPAATATPANAVAATVAVAGAAAAAIQEDQPTMELTALQERLYQTKKTLESFEDGSHPEMVSLMERLNRLIEKTNKYLNAESNSNS